MLSELRRVHSIKPQHISPSNQTKCFTCSRLHKFIICYLLFFILSAVIFSIIEEIAFIDSLYFIIVTQATVGNVDTPQTNGGMVFNVCFILIAATVAGISFILLLDYWVYRRINKLINDIEDDFDSNSIFHVQQEKTRKRKNKKKLYFCLYILWVTIWIIFFSTNPQEGPLTFFESFYFALVASTTIGYNLKPQSTGGKLFASLFIYIGMISFGMILMSLSKGIVNYLHKNNTKTIIEPKPNSKLLSRYKNNNEVITKHQYVLDNLLQNNKITREDYETIEKEFIMLDVDANGVLDQRDFELLQIENEIILEKEEKKEEKKEDIILIIEAQFDAHQKLTTSPSKERTKKIIDDAIEINENNKKKPKYEIRVKDIRVNDKKLCRIVLSVVPDESSKWAIERFFQNQLLSDIDFSKHLLSFLSQGIGGSLPLITIEDKNNRKQIENNEDNQIYKYEQNQKKQIEQ
eukprot:516298_1